MHVTIWSILLPWGWAAAVLTLGRTGGGHWGGGRSLCREEGLQGGQHCSSEPNSVRAQEGVAGIDVTLHAEGPTLP